MSHPDRFYLKWPSHKLVLCSKYFESGCKKNTMLLQTFFYKLLKRKKVSAALNCNGQNKQSKEHISADEVMQTNL
jgi:hypothetical protein